ncbi:thiopeptide-type bacteriocin biosynthesis protein [Pedobacter sp. MW01-1-1]|uniref:thiopeptide-type bacteriocin biosynthesis protein n=1 Tax=Pedobacter sp. MW01-1-1 TaxID=3383027 RepID=UPI003FF04418
MKVHIHPNILFRTPRFSYQSNLIFCWDELKKAIAISSTDFYEQIKDIRAEDLDSLPPKISFTIWKYYNRAKYRSTPYGTFASFSLLKNGLAANGNSIQVDEKQLVHQFIDWPQKNNIQFDIHELLSNNCRLFSNTSFYCLKDSIRYISCQEGLFELAEIDHNELVLQILEKAQKPIQVNALLADLDKTEIDEASILNLIADMHDLQLIFTDYDPNILGDEYFNRLGIDSAELPKYIIAERAVQSGAIDEHLLQSLPNFLALMNHIIPTEELDTLKEFMAKFSKKFDQEEVPLLFALDPETGVGYGSLEQSESNDLVSQLRNKAVTPSENNLKGSIQGLMQMGGFEKDRPILLNKLPLKLDNKPLSFPNTMSLLMSVCDDVVSIDQIGGVTANALSGRFSLASEAVEEEGKIMAEIEQQSNPDVLFFDVAYMVEAHIDNINRRKLLYNYQLSILNYDTSAEPLRLNDIFISIKRGEVILRSKTLNKRLIPRMASAYNYSRSDLSVFRLLCNLQHHKKQTGFTFKLSDVVPDLPYYPRLQYHNLIINRAKWRITKEVFYPEKQDPLTINQARTFLVELGVSRYFKAGLADQTLCFDMENDADVQAFILYMQKQKQVYIEEVLIPENSVVRNEKGESYLAQFILSLYHREKIYQPASVPEGVLTNSVKAFFPPGTEWLYFEIFCHQQRADQLLVGPIAHFLALHADQIKSWFFIRYNENGDHLRFRIQLNNPDDGVGMIPAFSAYLTDDMENGLVSDLQVKTYRRELERYGVDLIEAAELHFCTDSDFVLSLFETELDAFAKYQLCSKLVDEIQHTGIMGDKGLAIAIKMMSDSFNAEHHLDAPDFKRINAYYQEYRKAEAPALTDAQATSFKNFASSFTRLLSACKPEKRIKLLSDVMHMHVNRLFNKEQRTHEMMMYYFLWKDNQRKKAMA